jgi:3-dehydroquinate dehydratase
MEQKKKRALVKADRLETRIDYLERVLYQLFQLTERLLAMGKGKDGD